MGIINDFVCRQRFRQLVLYIILVSCFTQWRLMAEGRSIPLPAEAAKKGATKEEKMEEIVTSGIGSRPPRCEGRCSSCGHCEAVQVPVSPIVKGRTIKRHFSTAISTIASTRGDDISNYKPMSWKCKCGDLIFNP